MADRDSGAAMRRRKRRLRSWRHEQQSIGAAWPTYEHPLSPKGTEEGQDWGGRGEETSRTTRRDDPLSPLPPLLPQPETFGLSFDEEPPGRGLFLWLSLGRSSGYRGISWSSLPTSLQFLDDLVPLMVGPAGGVQACGHRVAQAGYRRIV